MEVTFTSKLIIICTTYFLLLPVSHNRHADLIRKAFIILALCNKVSISAGKYKHKREEVMSSIGYTTVKKTVLNIDYTFDTQTKVFDVWFSSITSSFYLQNWVCTLHI